MPASLPEPAGRLWRVYEETERHSYRPAVLESLGGFVDAFATLPGENRREWVRSFCREAFDGVTRRFDRPRSVIRQPLFDGVLLPSLAELFRAGDPDAALWLCVLTDCGVTRDRERTAAALGIASLSRFAILRASLRSNPHHAELRRELKSEMAHWFDYSLHELPAGVLYGFGHGATPEQCEELLAEIEEYRRLASDDSPVRPEETAWWEFHFRSYRDYLRDNRGTGSYADYLDAFAGTPPPPLFEAGRRYPYGKHGSPSEPP